MIENAPVVPPAARPGTARGPARGRGLGPLLVGAEWRHHPWRQAAAVMAVALGVALAFAVQLINASALAEFDQAARAAAGTPDTVLRAATPTFDEALYPLVARRPDVALVSPVVEVDTAWRDAAGHPHPLKLLGLDALVAPALSPGWAPLPPPATGGRAASSPGRPATGSDPRFAALDPDVVWLNAAARAAVGPGDTLALRTPAGWQVLRIGGGLAADGPPLAVIDIAGAQARFDRVGRLSRLDVRLRPGATVARLSAALAAATDGQAALHATSPDAPVERMARLTRAYRVNLGVLALVALFTGAFLVFSVQSLAVAKRVPQLALLGVLGLDGRGRRALVLADGALVGVLGAVLGLGLGTALAAAALRALGGDLGSGVLGGGAPSLQWSPAAAAVYGALGVASALAGAAWPARAARALAPAQALKGLSTAATRPWPAWAGALAMALGLVLALVPPWGDVPWAAYVGVALLLLGGIGLVPQAVALGLSRLQGLESPVASLAVARAVDQRHTATAAVAGVVASLSLVVALTVMISSFRDSLSAWLSGVLPADVYLRVDPEGARDAAFLPPAVLDAARRSPAVDRVRPQRQELLQLSPDDPPVALLARDEPDARDGLPDLPWVQAPSPGNTPSPASPRDARTVDVYASEVLASLRHLRPGDTLVLPLPAGPVRGVVRGIWRDYARQQGALVMSLADWRRLTGDDRVTDLALWWRSGTPPATQAATLDALRAASPPGAPLQSATRAELRSVSLDIFDRSFAVTRWLQGVALAIGLAGIAASFSAQVLARRREFGTLQHLGFTRRQVLALVTAEGALWTAVGAVMGVALGLVVSVVLVDVVNPQSFHWTMRWSVPWPRLAGLAVATVAAGALTAWAAGHAAAGRDMARSVKEDW